MENPELRMPVHVFALSIPACALVRKTKFPRAGLLVEQLLCTCDEWECQSQLCPLLKWSTTHREHFEDAPPSLNSSKFIKSYQDQIPSRIETLLDIHVGQHLPVCVNFSKGDVGLLVSGNTSRNSGLCNVHLNPLSLHLSKGI